MKHKNLFSFIILSLLMLPLYANAQNLTPKDIRKVWKLACKDGD